MAIITPVNASQDTSPAVNNKPVLFTLSFGLTSFIGMVVVADFILPILSVFFSTYMRPFCYPL